MYSIICSVCIFVICSGAAIADKIYPSDLPKCHKGDNKCITEVVQLFATNYSDGIPAINLPSLDPINLGKIDMIREKKSGILGIAQVLEHIKWTNSNIQLHGFKNATFIVTGFEKNLIDSNVAIKILIPTVIYTADYKLDFKFLKRHTHGKGKLHFDFKDCEIHMNFTLQIYEKDDGKQYMKIDQAKVDYIVRIVSNLNFGTLFDGNELLSRLEHEFLNNNGHLLIDIIRPESTAEYSKYFPEILDPIFSKFSIDQLFLIDE